MKAFLRLRWFLLDLPQKRGCDWLDPADEPVKHKQAQTAMNSYKAHYPGIVEGEQSSTKVVYQAYSGAPKH